MKRNKKEEIYKEFLRLNEEYSDLQWGSRGKIMYEELDKCDLLCSNCHRIRHHVED